tara:strand:+ start:176 stop:514 length:339 start_codon:yes stop_codon:yes gene_type:complete
MAHIGYPDTKNKLGGGPTPLKGIFGAAVSAAKGTTKKKGKTKKAKNVPKQNKGEGIFEYTGRLAQHLGKGKSSEESSGDAVIAYKIKPPKAKKQEQWKNNRKQKAQELPRKS